MCLCKVGDVFVQVHDLGNFFEFDIEVLETQIPPCPDVILKSGYGTYLQDIGPPDQYCLAVSAITSKSSFLRYARVNGLTSHLYLASSHILLGRATKGPYSPQVALQSYSYVLAKNFLTQAGPAARHRANPHTFDWEDANVELCQQQINHAVQHGCSDGSEAGSTLRSADETQRPQSLADVEAPHLKTARVCGHPECKMTVGLLKCPCGLQFYCGPDHQAAAWRAHRREHKLELGVKSANKFSDAT